MELGQSKWLVEQGETTQSHGQFSRLLSKGKEAEAEIQSRGVEEWKEWTRAFLVTTEVLKMAVIVVLLEHRCHDRHRRIRVVVELGAAVEHQDPCRLERRERRQSESDHEQVGQLVERLP